MHLLIIRREEGEAVLLHQCSYKYLTSSGDNCDNLSCGARRHPAGGVLIRARRRDLHNVAVKRVARPFGRNNQILGFLARRSFSGDGGGCRRNGKKSDALPGHRYRAFIYGIRRHFLIL